MIRKIRKREILLTLSLVVLAAAALAGCEADRRMRRARHAFSVDRYRSVMGRIDVTVESIGEKMAFEGLASDFEELLAAGSNAVREAEQKVAAVVTARTEEELRVTGVIWSDRDPVAFINGAMVGVGDLVGTREVVEINEESVQLRDVNGVVKRVFLYEEP